MAFPRIWTPSVAALLACMALAQAPVASAALPPAPILATNDERINRGEIVVNLVSDHPIYHLDVYGAVQGTPEEVWEAVTDYYNYKDFLPLVTESSVRKRAGNTVHQFVKMNPPWPFHEQWMVNANVEDKANWRVSWTMADGNIKYERGYWAIVPLPDGRTRVQYHLTVDPWMDSMPSWVVAMVTRTIMPEVVKGVRKRVADTRSAKK